MHYTPLKSVLHQSRLNRAGNSSERRLPLGVVYSEISVPMHATMTNNDAILARRVRPGDSTDYKPALVELLFLDAVQHTLPHHIQRRLLAREEFELRGGLAHEHLEAAHHHTPGRSRLLQQHRLERGVHCVKHQGEGGQCFCGHRRRVVVRVHADGGGVGEHVAAHLARRHLLQGSCLAPHRLRQGLRPVQAAVRNHDGGGAAREGPKRQRPARAARPQHHHASPRQRALAASQALLYGLNGRQPVRVVPFEAAVRLADEGVDRSDARGHGVHLLAAAQRRLLVGDGHAVPLERGHVEGAQEGLEVMDEQRHVTPL
mmetsp:Transcript_13315/g.25541  ORF Transcript_13315/g.25541 Transcript_13315/m.25541 type:complete len:316 (+) Transcript_13315:292-1239(+)